MAPWKSRGSGSVSWPLFPGRPGRAGLPRRTTRLRPTALYGMLFLASGAGLLAITNVSSQMPPSADAAIRSRSLSSAARPCHDWELTRQKDSIASHLTQLRQLLGGQLPGMDEALQSAPAKPGIGPALQADAAALAGGQLISLYLDRASSCRSRAQDPPGLALRLVRQQSRPTRRGREEA
jgi:hypothetical protein